MGSLKIIGIVLLVLAVPLVLAAILYMGSSDPPIPVFVGDDATKTGYVAGGAGGFLLLAGIVLLIVSPRARRQELAVAETGPQEVVIKRTEMNLAGATPRSEAEALNDQLEAINQKISRIKVKFGMGEVSNESFKRLMAEYEQERAGIEKQIYDAEG